MIQANGETPVTRLVTGEDYLQALLEKLNEEVREVNEAETEQIEQKNWQMS